MLTRIKLGLVTLLLPLVAFAQSYPNPKFSGFTFDTSAHAQSATSNLQYLQGGTGSVSRPVTSKLGDVVNALDFGATAINADNTAAIQAAINVVNAAGGGTVTLPPVTLKVLGQIVLHSNVSLKGTPGLSVLDTSSRANYQSNELQPLVMAKGTKGAAIALTANAAYGTYTLSVASTAGLAVGNEIELTANSTGGFNDSSVTVFQGELFFITGLTSTTITVNRPVLDQAGYTTANSATISVITPVSNITISGITLIGKGRDATLPGDMGIGIFYGYNVKIDNNIVKYVDSRAIYVVGCYGCEITRNKTLFNLVGTNTNVNYGIYYASDTIYLRVSGNYGENMRHAIVSGHLSLALTEKYPGINRGIDLGNNVAVSAWLTGIATHNDVEYLNAHDNYVEGGVNGINLRERNAYAINNVVVNCSGVGLFLSANPQKQVWQGNKVIGCPTGLTTGSITTGFNMGDIDMIDNRFYGVTNSGIFMQDTVNTGPFRNVNSIGNLIAESPNGAGGNSAAIRYSGAFSGSIANNVAFDLVNMIGVRLEATTVNVQLRSNNALNCTTSFSVVAGATGILGLDNYYKGYTTGFSGSSNLMTGSANNIDGGSGAY
jgi:hypothetical protein